MGEKREDVWTERERNAAWRMSMQRQSMADMADKLGRTPEAVKAKLYRMRKAMKKAQHQQGL